MTRAIISFDTELSAGLYQKGADARANFESSILGRCRDGDFGIHCQMDMLERHGLTGVFFIDPMPALVYGPKVIDAIVRPVVERGHEVQVHIHTEWLAFARFNPVGRLTGRNIGDFPLAAQKKLIALARDILVGAGAPKPTAFRAGNFGANDDTLRALAMLGFRFDSSFNGAYLGRGCNISLDARNLGMREPHGAVEVPVKDIFSSDYLFNIPGYQRPYAWTTEQAEELFNDLVSAMQDARTSGTASQYFLGSIVLIKNDREPKSSVVDGQQRLSTLTMLFAVLRAVMPDAADDITDFLYKKGKVSLGETNEYRLIAREEDADFFRSFVQELGGIARLVASTDRLEDSRLRFRENAALLLEKATALPSAEHDALWKFLANDCSLVVISTPDLEAAYRIFSVLNNRGLDLAPIDIIKAAVLGSIRTISGDATSRVYAKEWSQIESTLGRDAFGDLFVHIRTIYAKQKQRATLVKEFQDHVTEYRMPIDLVDKVIKPYAEVWDFVRDADFEATELAESINDRLSWLNRVDFKDWVPPALVYFKRTSSRRWSA